jgi:hypothetical protein
MAWLAAFADLVGIGQLGQDGWLVISPRWYFQWGLAAEE